MKHKHLNQETSKYQSDSRTVTSEPLHASSSKLNNPTLENSHISCLDLDLDLDFTNGRYDYDVNLSISPIIILNVCISNYCPTDHFDSNHALGCVWIRPKLTWKYTDSETTHELRRLVENYGNENPSEFSFSKVRPIKQIRHLSNWACVSPIRRSWNTEQEKSEDKLTGNLSAASRNWETPILQAKIH